MTRTAVRLFIPLRIPVLRTDPYRNIAGASVRYRTDLPGRQCSDFGILRTNPGVEKMAIAAQASEPASGLQAQAATRCGPRPAARLPLIIGLGNADLCDDGVGVELARRLQNELGPGAAVCIDGGLMSLSLFPFIERAAAVVVMHSANLRSEPGTVEIFEDGAMDAFLASARPRAVHERGLIDLLDLARQRACLPVRRALVCIQPKRLEWGEALSLPVFRALPRATELVGALLERWRQ